MSMTEGLRVQLDTTRLEVQQLQIENARLRDANPQQAEMMDSLTDLEAQRDSLQQELKGAGEEKERLKAEVAQIDSIYTQLVSDSREEQLTIERLREELEATKDRAKRETESRRETAELELHRAVAKEREKWEVREERLVRQLEEQQRKYQENLERELQRSPLGSEDSMGGDQEPGCARTRPPAASATVSDFVPLTPTTHLNQGPPSLWQGGHHSDSMATTGFVPAEGGVFPRSMQGVAGHWPGSMSSSRVLDVMGGD